ncbi:hypothetical protein K503DRAFT_486835 [Rhizopogon vinicolor AM-OR11-026]|uniref:Uncharacterized protein n=1 Tax=Rhizopogon vinicolor AM-OR11-026 TaxID=1314800 RepID=A0A1B7MMR5_9AGAM|nr:hypothetical protein K503DRAFT_486835 [Rhizopogon vinicolor AM-OR11-026]
MFPASTGFILNFLTSSRKCNALARDIGWIRMGSTLPFNLVVASIRVHLFVDFIDCLTSNIVTRTRWCSVQTHIYSAKVACLITHPTSWLDRFLTPTLLELYHRVKQRKEIETAALENLVECPFAITSASSRTRWKNS